MSEQIQLAGVSEEGMGALIPNSSYYCPHHSSLVTLEKMVIRSRGRCFLPAFSSPDSFHPCLPSQSLAKEEL